MRCPKCGNISFDDLSSCVKCSASLAETAKLFHGTTIKAEAPFFLGNLMAEGAGGAGETDVAFEESEAPDEAEYDQAVSGSPVEEDEAEEMELDEAESGYDEEADEEGEDAHVGLQGIDVSDLVPSQEEGSEEEIETASSADEEIGEEDETEISTAGPSVDTMESINIDMDDTASADGAEQHFMNDEEAGIVDLSALMEPEEEEQTVVDELAETAPAEQDEQEIKIETESDDDDSVDLSLDEEEIEPEALSEEEASDDSDQQIKLSLEGPDDEKPVGRNQLEEKPQISASGLSLENDDDNDDDDAA